MGPVASVLQMFASRVQKGFWPIPMYRTSWWPFPQWPLNGTKQTKSWALYKVEPLQKRSTIQSPSQATTLVICSCFIHFLFLDPPGGMLLEVFIIVKYIKTYKNHELDPPGSCLGAKKPWKLVRSQLAAGGKLSFCWQQQVFMEQSDCRGVFWKAMGSKLIGILDWWRISNLGWRLYDLIVISSSFHFCPQYMLVACAWNFVSQWSDPEIEEEHFLEVSYLLPYAQVPGTGSESHSERWCLVGLWEEVAALRQGVWWDLEGLRNTK